MLPQENKGFLLLKSNFKVILLARVKLSCKHNNWNRAVDFLTAEKSMDAS